MPPIIDDSIKSIDHEDGLRLLRPKPVAFELRRTGQPRWHGNGPARPPWEGHPKSVDGASVAPGLIAAAIIGWESYIPVPDSSLGSPVCALPTLYRRPWNSGWSKEWVVSRFGVLATHLEAITTRKNPAVMIAMRHFPPLPEIATAAPRKCRPPSEPNARDCTCYGAIERRLSLQHKRETKLPKFHSITESERVPLRSDNG